MRNPLPHNARHTALLVVQVVLMLLLCGFAVALGQRFNRRFDLTPTQSFVLSDQSKQIAAAVPKPAHFVIFFNNREGDARRQYSDLLQQFGAENRKISYDLYDLDRTPGLAKRYDITNYNTGVAESDGRKVDLAGIDEVNIASALLKLSRSHPKSLCFLVGHGEHSPQKSSERRGYSDVAKALETEGFSIRNYDVLPGPADLEKCTIVISAGPVADFFEEETKRLEAYVRDGGRVLLLIDPNPPRTVTQVLKDFGVEVPSEIIVDGRNRLYGADAYMARVPIFDKETFGQKLQLAAVFSLATALEPMDPPPEGIEAALLALSGPDSWGRVGGGDVQENVPKFRPDVDKPGPLPVAMMVKEVPAAAEESQPPSGRLAVFGDSDFASNFYLNLLGNKDLFMSTIGVLSEEPALVAVRRKGLPAGSLSPIFLTAAQGQIIFWASVVATPALVLLLGLAISFRRQRRGARS